MARKPYLNVALAAATVVLVSLSAAAQEKGPDVTANADGSCVYHKPTGGGQREDINVANGATYHQDEVKGRRSGTIFVPARTYLCKDGHFSRQ